MAFSPESRLPLIPFIRGLIPVLRFLVRLPIPYVASMYFIPWFSQRSATQKLGQRGRRRLALTMDYSNKIELQRKCHPWRKILGKDAIYCQYLSGRTWPWTCPVQSEWLMMRWWLVTIYCTVSEEKVLTYCYFRSMHIPNNGLRHDEVGFIGSS